MRVLGTSDRVIPRSCVNFSCKPGVEVCHNGYRVYLISLKLDISDAKCKILLLVCCVLDTDPFNLH